MKRFKNLFYWTGISLGTVCIFIITVGQYLPFEFTNQSAAFTFYTIIGCALPVASILVLLKPLKSRLLKIILVVIAIISVPILGLFAFGSSMCGFSTDKVLFVKKSDSTYTITQRHYDCGAWDSDLPDYKYFKIKKITTDIIYAKEIDTLRLNFSIWRRVDKDSQ